MALTPTAPINLLAIGTEAGVSTPVSLTDARIRSLANKPTGNVSLLDLLGKSAVDLTPNNISFNPVYAGTDSQDGMSYSPNYQDTPNVTINGISGPITLKFTGNRSGDAGVQISYSKNNGPWITCYHVLINHTSPNVNDVTVVMNNNDTLKFRVTIYCENATNWNTYIYRYASGSVPIINTSSGNTVIGTLSFSGSSSDTFGGGDGGMVLRP